MLLYGDNQVALVLTCDPCYHMKAKQIHVSFHLTQDLVADGLITTLFIHSADNIANIFTKALSHPTHERLHKQLSLAPVVKGECCLSPSHCHAPPATCPIRNRHYDSPTGVHEASAG